MKRKGMLFTFEGIDGSGKSTQLRLAAEYLRKARIPLLVIREPGSTSVAEKVRKILLSRSTAIAAETELMLYLAARADLYGKKIGPALKKGTTVLCDRFYDSTAAYQGFGRGLDIELIRRLNLFVTSGRRPDLTFVFDLDYKASLGRRKKKSDRLEAESRRFFQRVRRGFLQIAAEEEKRVVVVDGTRPMNEVFAEVKDCLRRKMGL